MTLEKDIYKSPKSKSFTFSLAFLLFVVTLTIGLYWYNYYLSWENLKLESQYKEKQKLVAEKKQQKQLKIYSLYTINKWAIDRLDKYSQIRKYINHLEQISNKYWVIFKWFSISNWIVMTNWYTVSDDNGIDYQKTVNFLRNYKKDKRALFNIVPIKWVDTFDSNQKFNLTFKIK